MPNRTPCFSFISLVLLVLGQAACSSGGAANASQSASADAKVAADVGDGLRGTFFMVDGYGNHHLRTFFPSGMIYSGVPAGGPEVFGVEQARAARDPRELGTYTLPGDSLIIEWGGGQGREAKTFGRKGANLVLDGYSYEALPKYTKGQAVDGSYTTRSYNSMGVAGGGSMTWGGASTVVFRPDGTFDYGRAGSASTTAGDGTATSGAEHANGRYAIGGNTVSFTFSDGSVQHALIHPWAGDESKTTPESLNLNGHTYTRDE